MRKAEELKMNDDILETYERLFGTLAKQMDEETMACSTAVIQMEGEEYGVPAFIVKGPPDTVMERPIVRCQVLGIETSECAVVAVGVEFPFQTEALQGWYWSWLPMHTTEQRALLGLMATAPVWLLVIFSGEAVSRALIVRVNDIARARYRQLKLVVESYPTNPIADTKRAIDAAQEATADALGDGYVLETVRDLGQGGSIPEE
jgi:hypothetical protein